MYSPRIWDDLIPDIYRAARAAGIPMTTWVNQVIEQALSERAAREGKEKGTESVVTRLCSQRNRKEKEDYDTTAI